jgi:hypothetical protein
MAPQTLALCSHQAPERGQETIFFEANMAFKSANELKVADVMTFPLPLRSSKLQKLLTFFRMLIYT